MFLPSPGLAPKGMTLCLCSWLCVLSMSRCSDSPFWPSQSAHLSSALYDHNDPKLSSWAQSKVSTVQAITKGGLVLLFNKAKTTLQVCGRSCTEDAFPSFQQTAFLLFFSITFWLVLLWALSSSVLQTPSMFFECKLLFSSAHTRLGAPTLVLVWQRLTVCVLYQTICFVSVQ